MELQKLLPKIIPSEGFISPGELYRDAMAVGYVGSQENLLKLADEMVSEDVLCGRNRGMSQLRWYTGGKK